MSKVMILLYFFMLMIGSALVVYFFVYKRNINKKLQEQSYKTDLVNEKNYKRMPDFHIVAIVIVVVMIISSLSSANNRIDRLNDSVENLQQIADEMNELQDEVEELKDSIAYNNSIINDIEVKCGKLNTADNTAEISFKVTLKNKLTDAKYMIKINDNTAVLKDGENDCVVGSMNLNIFGEYEKMFFVCEKSDGEKITEKIEDGNRIFEDSYLLLSDDGATLYEEYMLHIYGASIRTGSSFFSKEKSIDAELEIRNGDYIKDNTEVISAKFVTESDGEIIEEKAVEDKNKSTFHYSKSIDTNKYTDLDCYLELSDSRGYVYKYYYFMLRNGDELEDSFDNYMKIYDSNGNLLIETNS